MENLNETQKQNLRMEAAERVARRKAGKDLDGYYFLWGAIMGWASVSEPTAEEDAAGLPQLG